ncbi:uncharacterized protein DUF2809 [Neolewinella xylanilytica]|uniref:Uncharacterized protein DUF2809 n=1 Tax=Neolewinella xylanilytica TaxID=1514080 RepID=A0A2S6IA28_9BACT|nr:DUF2809 domain-containing protein [Neolewinella xylanilytica]PPK88351.1 uncharacterized protein DUF2809 [Neolewinella xylanilytica]
MLTFRPRYFLLTVVLFLVEVAIALFVRDAWVRPYGGDFLVVILIYCFLRTFVARPPLTLAVVTLVFSFAVEFAQLFRIVEVLGLKGNRLAETVIGTGFSLGDLVAYSLGVIVAYALDRRYGDRAG